MTPHAVVATDEHGQITDFNAGAERMLGYTADEVIGRRNMAELYAEDELARRAAAMGVRPGFDVVRAAPKLGRWDERACTWRTHTGGRLPVNVTVCAYTTADARATGYAFWARPITRAEHALRDRDGWLYVSQELLIKTDRDNCILEASQSFERVLGYRPVELLGRRVAEFVHPDDLKPTRSALAEIHAGAWAQHFENRWRHKNGAWRTISWDAAARQGDLVSYGGGLDVTDEKRRAREREQHLAFERKVVGIVSHDLRNPITAISLSEQLIRRDPADAAAVAHNLERIGQSVQHAERLLHDLLDFSRARIGGGLSVRPRPCCLVAVVQRTVQACRALVPEPEVRLIAPKALPVCLDPQRVQQLVDNLVRNAFAHGDGHSPITVRIEAPAAAGGDVTICVHNFGPPIAPEDRAHLFAPFWQARGGGRDEAGHSVGLGLYIVQQIALAHGGDVVVDSDASRGTCFAARLPQRAPNGGQTPDAPAPNASG